MIDWELTNADLKKYLSGKDVKDYLGRALDWIEEEPSAVIPSLELDTDGISLDHVLVVTEKFIADVRLHPEEEDFDVILKKHVSNIRINLSIKTIKNESDVTKFWLGEVVLLHSFDMEFRTEVSFAGKSSEERETWVALVKQAFPSSLLE